MKKMTMLKSLNSNIDRRLPYFSIGILLFSNFGYLHAGHFAFELFSHFAFQYLFLGIIILLFAIFRRFWASAAIITVAILINLGELAPYIHSNANETQVTNSQPLKVFLANVLSSNQHFDQLISHINYEKPEIIILQEINDRWAANLEKLNVEYPFQRILPRNDNFGMAIYSKYELANQKILDFSELAIPSISAEIKLPSGRSFRLISTHPIPPISARAAALRNNHLLSLAAEVLKIKKDAIVAGDLNATMYSYPYKQMIRESGLINVRTAKGLFPTWPAKLGGFGIPIDHILYKGSISCKKLGTLSNFGSDHLPLVAELQFN